jgi:flagellar biosynthetic protein FliP
MVFSAVSLFAAPREQVFAASAMSVVMPLPNINVNIGSEGDDGTASALQIMMLFVLIALIPTVLLMMTSFTRILIIMHFMRAALATQQMPPNSVLIGIALILTMFLMQQPLDRIYNEAYLPFQSGAISSEEFGARLIEPLRDYMLTSVGVHNDDLGLFANIAGFEMDSSTPAEDIPLIVIVPAFMLSELKAGFQAGLWIYIPFIVIDMVVASTLMAMGMMMLPPAMISMPFKLMVFVLTDGWRWIVVGIVESISRF